ncbi:X2-like carbohydrate binding domain-containing protein [Cloacibacillus porcorum]|uniref:X2-like carbohydrate binding domain-containing protein n=1 Tax=Cloacibacillus porcorum TaxID=1197717 RepID=UPI0023F27AA7|nr:X2-like carbohydrate binding domain-containing protein [Cloacibacillus porcorum]MCC8185003.1 hypothetical protein [Cloacibacillus porcorum]
MSPETATFSKAAPADVVLTVTGASSITAMKNGGATVNTSNYTFTEGTLTILGDYLSTLTNGEKTITIETDNGGKTVKITVGD